MGIYTLLLAKKGKILDGQRFLTVSIFTLSQSRKKTAVDKICKAFEDDYEFLQVSRMRLSNFFRFL